MQKKKISKRELVLLTILFAIIINYIYYYNILSPIHLKVAALNNEVEKNRQISLELPNKKKELLVIKQKIETDKSVIESIEKQIPFNKRIPELIVKLDAAVAQHAMLFRSIGFGELNSSNEIYGMFPINFVMEGQYDNIIAFLHYIEDNDRRYVIDSFSLQPKNRLEIMPFSISFRTFVLNDGTEHPEPLDYPFLRGILGKEYPFVEEIVEIPSEDLGIVEGDTNVSDLEDVLEVEKLPIQELEPEVNNQ